MRVEVLEASRSTGAEAGDISGAVEYFKVHTSWKLSFPCYWPRGYEDPSVSGNFLGPAECWLSMANYCLGQSFILLFFYSVTVIINLLSNLQ